MLASLLPERLAATALRLAHQLRQFSNIGGNAPCLVAREQYHNLPRGAPQHQNNQNGNCDVVENKCQQLVQTFKEPEAKRALSAMANSWPSTNRSRRISRAPALDQGDRVGHPLPGADFLALATWTSWAAKVAELLLICAPPPDITVGREGSKPAGHMVR